MKHPRVFFAGFCQHLKPLDDLLLLCREHLHQSRKRYHPLLPKENAAVFKQNLAVSPEQSCIDIQPLDRGPPLPDRYSLIRQHRLSFTDQRNIRRCTAHVHENPVRLSRDHTPADRTRSRS